MYRADLAYVHHRGFTDIARSAAPGLLSLLRGAGIRGGPVVDLGTGSGVWLAALARAGFDPIGLDRSAALLRIARRVAPSATLYRGSIHQWAIARCRAVTMLGEVLNYCDPADGRHLPLGQFFRRVAHALEPRGLLVFDVLVEGSPRLEYRTWRAGPDWAVLVDVRESPGPSRVSRDIVVFRRLGTRFRRSAEQHVLRVFRREAIERALRAADFSVRVTRRIGGAALGPRRLAFVARLR